MKLAFDNQTIQQSMELEDAIKKFNSIFYGLKHYVWKMRDRSEITKRYKENGLFNNFVMAKGTRQSDGFYSRDEVNWDAYNKAVWQEYSNEFQEKAGLPKDAKTIKQISEKKHELIMYFLENYGHKVQLVVKNNPLKDKIFTEEGLVISHKGSIFTIKSPNGNVVVTVKEGKIKLEIKGNSISFKAEDTQKFQQQMRIAELIALNPQKALDNPYIYLGIDTTANMKIQSAQEFLIKENEEHMAKMNARKAKTQDQQLTHENYTEKKVTVSINLNDNKTIDEIKSDGQAYTWKNFSVVKGNHYYGVRAMAYLEWLTSEEISAKCHRFMIDNDGLESVIDISHNEEITAIDSEYKNILIQDKKDSTILWIPEEDFQVWRSLNK